MLHILNVWELWHTSDIQFCEMFLNHNKFIPPALSYYTKCQYNYPNTQDLLFFHSLISQYTLISLTLAITWLMTWQVDEKSVQKSRHATSNAKERRWSWREWYVLWSKLYYWTGIQLHVSKLDVKDVRTPME